MPIREYKCSGCGCQFESIDLGRESDHRSDKTICPNCGSKDIGRKLSLFSSRKGEASSCDTRTTSKRFR